MKTCSKCKQEKPLDAFRRRSDYNAPRSRCKECQREDDRLRRASPAGRAYEREYRQRNADRLKEYHARWSAENHEKRREYAVGIRHRKAEQWKILDEYKRDRGCIDCGTSEGVLDFDHRERGSKRWAVSRALGCSWDSLWAEVAKCDVRCHACHARRHAEARHTGRGSAVRLAAS